MTTFQSKPPSFSLPMASAFAYPSLPILQKEPRLHPPQFTCCTPSPKSRRFFLRRILFTLSIPLLQSTTTTSATAEPPTSKTLQQPPFPKPTRKGVWGYDAEIGPTSWSRISPGAEQCLSALDQSPIDLSYRSALARGFPGTEYDRPLLQTNPATFLAKYREISPGAISRWLVIEPYIQPPPPLIFDAPPVDTYKPPPRAAVLDIPNIGEYALQSFHFHAGGSEHTFEGRAADMEVHFVFSKQFSFLPRQDSRKSKIGASSKSGQDDVVAGQGGEPKGNEPASLFSRTLENDLKLSPSLQDAVQNVIIAVLFRKGDGTNRFFDTITRKAIPDLENAADFPSSGVTFDLNLADVLPNLDSEEFYTYIGSLTVPPCTTNIYWTVVSSSVTVPAKSINALTEAQGGPNIRPTQPLNGRPVIRFVPEAKRSTSSQASVESTA